MPSVSPTSSRLKRATAAAGILACSALAAPALAGPPFSTDDPVPVELGHWEIDAFSTATRAAGETAGILPPGLEVDYGAAPDLQMHIIVPLSFDHLPGGPMRTGLGDIELGAKYRFVDSGPGDWWPQIATFPLIQVPTGDARRGLGGGHTRAYLPIWMQKDFGAWSSYWGGGYWINPGAGNRNYWFAGWLLQRQVTHDLALAAEIFHQTADGVGGPDTTAFNIGGAYDFNAHEHLLFSAGRALRNVTATNQFSYYLGLQLTF